jgi:glutathione S-transferase
MREALGQSAPPETAGESIMAELAIFVGNKNYSSWSMRGWLALKATGAPFDEEVIQLDEATTKSTILKHSPSGRVPALRHGELVVWDSLAMCEYLAETFPQAGLLPADKAARAVARSVSAEMHAGFAALRALLPMNIRASYPGRPITPEAQADILRIQAIWKDCRKRFGADGPYLFGAFSTADCMYAPVASRFRTYKVDLEGEAQAYVDSVLAHPAVQEWAAAAENEPWIIEKYEF